MIIPTHLLGIGGPLCGPVPKRKWKLKQVGGQIAWVRKDPPAIIFEWERREGLGDDDYARIIATDRQLDAERAFMDHHGL